MITRSSFIFLYIVLGIASSICAQSERRMVLGEQPVLKVPKTNETMVIDGKMDEPIWKNAEARSFDAFYRVDKPTDEQQSIFKMVWDEQNLYLFYQFEDEYLTARETSRDGEPYNDDCAEIFIIPAPDSLESHFGFELNIYKASNDFVYFNQYYKGKDYVFKAFDPEFEAEVTYHGSLNDNSDIDKGWTLELRVPLATFSDLRSEMIPQEGVRWAIQAVRQDRNDADGRRRSTSTLFPIYDASKGVHQANRFGLIEFTE
ncbi:MAG: carbohydrate-binding family 9-like protein [Cyclobacteriaceae bacterium]